MDDTNSFPNDNSSESFELTSLDHTDLSYEPVEEVIGEIIDERDHYEQIAFLIGDMLKDIPIDVPYEEFSEEEFYNTYTARHYYYGFTEPEFKERKSTDTYSKFDFANEWVQIRSDKKEQIVKEVVEESKGKGWSEEEIQSEINDRIGVVRQKLIDIRSDIEHYQGLINSFGKSANPWHLHSMTVFQTLRLETDAACRSYIKAGGDVGEDCFIKKAATASEVGMTVIDVFRTNVIESAIISKATDMEISFDDIYSGTKAGTSVMGKIIAPFIDVGNAIGYAPGSILHHIFEKMDKNLYDKPTNDFEPPDIVVPDSYDQMDSEHIDPESPVEDEQIVSNKPETTQETDTETADIVSENTTSKHIEDPADIGEQMPDEQSEDHTFGNKIVSEENDMSDTEYKDTDSENDMTAKDDKKEPFAAEVDSDDDIDSVSINQDREDSTIDIDKIQASNISSHTELSTDFQPSEEVESITDTTVGNIPEYADSSETQIATDRPEQVESAPDADELAEGIVEGAVEAIENGTGENEVLQNVSTEISAFYEDQSSNNDVSAEDTVNRVADAVHEMASIFEYPEYASDVMLEGLPDETISNAVIQQIENVDAEMTVDATGTFGSIEYDISGNVINTMEYIDASDLTEYDAVDVDAITHALDSHMESAVEDPEIQDIISIEQSNPEGRIDQGTEADTDLISNEFNLESAEAMESSTIDNDFLTT